MYKVFIDGEAGTTGLQIRERLETHPHIEIVSIDPEKRKDLNAKKTLLQEIDVCILCLPDAASQEAAQLCQEMGVRCLDASSAHRTSDGWVYGLPEINPAQRQLIQSANLVSNPGCYATGATLLLRPLSDAGIFQDNSLIHVNAVSGYSGGGKQMIERYESENTDAPTFGLYGLSFQHKHTPEIQKWAKLSRRPVFIPSVAAYAQGMLVHIMLDNDSLKAQADTPEAIHALLDQAYAKEALVDVKPFNSEADQEPFLTPHGITGKNRCEIYCYANPEDPKQTLLVAKLDNLGKGASGACVQNLNIMLGLEESLAVEI